MVNYVFWECPVCQFTAITTTLKWPPDCPLCSEDCGKDVAMEGRPAREDDKAEGRDWRKETGPRYLSG